VKGRYILAGFLSVGMSLTGFAGELDRNTGNRNNKVRETPKSI
jgi:hypothetical protein